MTYFEDLSLYPFARTAARASAARNVGWLDANHQFPVEEPGSAFLDAVWEHCSILVVPTRGLHACELCACSSNTFVRHGTRLLLGSGQIRVFNSNGDVFAAPNLVYHYIFQHHYRPPDEFLRAVENGPHPATEEYRAFLKHSSVVWRENLPMTDEPMKFRFVRTEHGVEREIIEPLEEKRRR